MLYIWKNQSHWLQVPTTRLIYGDLLDGLLPGPYHFRNDYYYYLVPMIYGGLPVPACRNIWNSAERVVATPSWRQTSLGGEKNPRAAAV